MLFLLFDASGSMLQRFEGKRRIDVANAVLTDLVSRNLRPGTPVALRVFGDDEPGSCETFLRAPLAPLDPKALARTIAAVRPQNLAKTSIAASIARVAEDLAGATGQRTVVLVTDGRAAYGQFADAAGIAHITCIASAGERVLGSYHVQNVNGYQSRLKTWMAPFKGVASWYLPSYLGWRRMIEREAQRLTNRHIITEVYAVHFTSRLEPSP